MEVYEDDTSSVSHDDVRRMILSRIRRTGPCRTNHLFNAFGVTYPMFERAMDSLLEDKLIRKRPMSSGPRYDPEWELTPWFWVRIGRLRLRAAWDFCVGLRQFFRM